MPRLNRERADKIVRHKMTRTIHVEKQTLRVKRQLGSTGTVLGDLAHCQMPKHFASPLLQL